MDITQAAQTADELVSAEISLQNEKWGDLNERADATKRQLMHAAMAQLDALFDRHCGVEDAFDSPPEIYPEDWKGFRDYGSDVANLVVAAAFLLQEIKRLVYLGEDTTRTSRTSPIV